MTNGRRVFSVCAVVLAIAVGGAGRVSRAQGVTMHGYVDWSISSGGYPIVAGWGFPCGTSDLVERVDLVATQPGAAAVVVPVSLSAAIYRSDVYQVFAGTCPGMTFYSGWYIVANAPLSSGTWQIHLLIRYGTHTVASHRDLTIP